MNQRCILHHWAIWEAPFPGVSEYIQEQAYCLHLHMATHYIFELSCLLCLCFIIPWKLKWKVKVKSLSHDRLFATPWLQPARLFLPWDSPGKNTGVGRITSPGDLPNRWSSRVLPTQGLNLGLQADSFPSEPAGAPNALVSAFGALGCFRTRPLPLAPFARAAFKPSLRTRLAVALWLQGPAAAGPLKLAPALLTPSFAAFAYRSLCLLLWDSLLLNPDSV